MKLGESCDWGWVMNGVGDGERGGDDQYILYMFENVKEKLKSKNKIMSSVCVFSITLNGTQLSVPPLDVTHLVKIVSIAASPQHCLDHLLNT